MVLVSHDSGRDDGPYDFSQVDKLSIVRAWNGKHFNSFSSFLGMFAKQQLTALDIGTNSGSFPRSLAEAYSERLSSTTGIDIAKYRTSENDLINGVQVDLVYNQSFERFSDQPEQQGKYDLIFVNCPAIDVNSTSFAERIKNLLTPNGALVITYHWEQMLTGVFNAFTTGEDLVAFLSELIKSSEYGRTFDHWLIDSLDFYPQAEYNAVPGIIAAFPNTPNVDHLSGTCGSYAAAILNATNRFQSIFHFNGDEGETVSSVSSSLIKTIWQVEEGKDLWRYKPIGAPDVFLPVREIIPIFVKELCGF